MHDERTIQAAKRVRELRALQLRVSRFGLAIAAGEEKQKSNACDNERRAIGALYSEWLSLLDAGAVDRDAVARLRQAVVRHEAELRTAEAHLRAAQQDRAAAAQRSGEAQVRDMAASGLLRRMHRIRDRKLAERALRDSEDHFVTHQARPA